MSYSTEPTVYCNTFRIKLVRSQLMLNNAHVKTVSLCDLESGQCPPVSVYIKAS